MTTSGTGVVTVVPDVAVLSLAAEVTDALPTRALDGAATALQDMVDHLLTAGTDRSDLRTVGTSSWTDPGETGADGLVVRAARTTVTLALEVRVPGTATAGALAGGALAAAGPAGRMQGIAFHVSDAAPATATARELAFAQAVGAARQIATLAARALGEVLEVREESAPAGVALAFRAEKAAGSAPLEPGQQDVRVQLTVRHAWA